MKRTLTALATVTALTFSFNAASAQSMDMGFNMLTGAIYNAFVELGIPTDSVNTLTIAQIAQIKAVLDDDMTSSQKGRIQAIVAQTN
ncbi:MAG: hypothetical protein ACE5FS_16415 [Paracoccaceae bacterium]